MKSPKDNNGRSRRGMSALAMLLAAIAQATPPGGPIFDVDALAEGEWMTYSIPQEGGTEAEIEAIGTAGDLNLYVYDLLGRLIVADDGPEVNAKVTFTVPRSGATYRVVVENASLDAPSAYRVEFR